MFHSQQQLTQPASILAFLHLKSTALEWRGDFSVACV